VLVALATLGCRPESRTATPGGGRDAADEVIATFGDRALRRSDVLEQLAPLAPRQRSYLTTEDRKRQLVENLVINELMYEEGKRLGFDDAEVERKVQSLRQRLVVQRVMAKYQEPPELTDEEVRAHYDANPGLYSNAQIRVSDIRVADEPTARDILAEVRADPARFAEIARERSGHAASAANGGDLGTFGEGRMELAFDVVAFSLAPGQIADKVVEGHDGYHVIMVTERKEGTRLPFEQVKDAIRVRLRNSAVREGLQRRVAQLKREANVQIDEEALARLNPADAPVRDESQGGAVRMGH